MNTRKEVRVVETMTYSHTQSMTASIRLSQMIVDRESYHKKNTRGVNHALLQQLLAFCGHDPNIGDITETFCSKFSKFLTGRVSLNSTRTYLQKLVAVLEYAVSKRFISTNPMPPIKEMLPHFTKPIRTYLTLDEISSLADTPCRHPETKRAFLFACQTGLRLSDIETLSWTDIACINGTYTIVKTQVKTGHEVRIPLNPIALQLLGEKRQQGLVFNLKSRSVISSDLREWASKAGISKRVTFHVSRHTFATQSISAGVDIYVVSKLCGHSTVKTTEIYAHMVDKTLQQGVNLLGKAMMEGCCHAQKNRKISIVFMIKLLIWKVFNRRNKIETIVNNT